MATPVPKYFTYLIQEFIESHIVCQEIAWEEASKGEIDILDGNDFSSMWWRMFVNRPPTFRGIFWSVKDGQVAWVWNRVVSP